MFKFISNYLTRPTDHWWEQYQAEQKARRKRFLPYNDEDLAKKLGGLAKEASFDVLGGRFARRAIAAKEDLDIGLKVLMERVKTDGLDQHPALASIVQEMAAISPNDLSDSKKRVIAVINATKESPWRTLLGSPKLASDQPAPAA